MPRSDWQTVDYRRSYDACIRAMRLQGVREGRFEPIPGDEEEMAIARKRGHRHEPD